MHHVPGPFPLPLPMVPVPDDLRWEYLRLERNVRTESAPSEAEMNALGAEGWELAGVYFDSPMLHLYLKRPA